MWFNFHKVISEYSILKKTFSTAQADHFLGLTCLCVWRDQQNITSQDRDVTDSELIILSSLNVLVIYILVILLFFP